MNQFLIAQSHLALTCKKFNSTDTKERYDHILKKEPSHWVDTPIEYKFNKYGFRTTLDNPPTVGPYYAAFGCSETVGVGIPEYARYSNIIEDETGIPVLNLGISGGSVNGCYLNMLHLLLSNHTPPDTILLQVPSLERYLLPTENEDCFIAMPKGNNVFTRQFFVKHLKKVSNYYLQLIDQLGKKFNIKIIKFSLLPKGGDDIQFIPLVDRARDNWHVGIQTNKNVATWILSEIENNV